MDDDDDLWGPPFVVEEDTLWKQTRRGCEFWFDCRTDVIEEHFQNERCCELVWRILTEKKQDELENEVASSGSGDSHAIASSDSDKTLSAILPDADTSSAKSDLDEDENTSSISDALTIDTRDSSNDTRGIHPDTRLNPVEPAANDPPKLEVVEDAYTSFSPVLASKIDEVEEHSCSSLVTDQVFDPIKAAPESKSQSAMSQENIGCSTLTPLLLETREEVREKENATNEGADHQQSDSLQDIVTASEPFTTESLLEMCDDPEKDREISCDQRSKSSQIEAVKNVVKDELITHPEAVKIVVKTVVKDEPITNMFTEERQKTESNALMNPRSVLIKKRQNASNSESFIRNTKQKVQGETCEISVDPGKKSTHEIVRGAQHAGSLSVLVDRKSERGGHSVTDMVISTSELKNKTGKELRSIAKALKVTHYYKLKKDDLLLRLTSHLSPS